MFLCPTERNTLMALHPAICSYSRLRLSASVTDVTPLTLPRLLEPADAPTDQVRVAMLAVALLRFNFNYGDLIRWLRGPYTHAHRCWTCLNDCLAAVRDSTPPPSWPRVNFAHTQTVMEQGVPLQGHYSCSWASVIARNLHPLSPDLSRDGSPSR
mgnify:FL=1